MSTITNDIHLALARLKNDDIVAIPTETVYGLAGSVVSGVAIRKVYATKHRPTNHPLIMHVAAQWDLSQWVSYIPDYAYTLMEAFWPGPLTLIFPLKPGSVNPLVTGGQNTIAIRAPNHVLAQELLLQLGQPLAAPSANPYGKISPTTAEHVQHSFPNDDFLILQGGRCAIGLESTIVSALDRQKYQILRQGVIDASHIAAKIASPCKTDETDIRVPGAMLYHYQPEKKLYYFNDRQAIEYFLSGHQKIPYVFTFSKKYHDASVLSYQFSEQSDDAAYEFYYRLRIADESTADVILMELPAKTDRWMALREKIVKAGRPMN